VQKSSTTKAGWKQKKKKGGRGFRRTKGGNLESEKRQQGDAEKREISREKGFSRMETNQSEGALKKSTVLKNSGGKGKEIIL